MPSERENDSLSIGDSLSPENPERILGNERTRAHSRAAESSRASVRFARRRSTADNRYFPKYPAALLVVFPRGREESSRRSRTFAKLPRQFSTALDSVPRLTDSSRGSCKRKSSPYIDRERLVAAYYNRRAIYVTEVRVFRWWETRRESILAPGSFPRPSSPRSILLLPRETLARSFSLLRASQRDEFRARLAESLVDNRAAIKRKRKKESSFCRRRSGTSHSYERTLLTLDGVTFTTSCERTIAMFSFGLDVIKNNTLNCMILFYTILRSNICVLVYN